jgi:CRP-like cAMP-binding protein
MDAGDKTLQNARSRLGPLSASGATGLSRAASDRYVQDKATLSTIEPFRGLPAADLEAMARRCRWRRYGPGEQVVGHQEESRDVFFVVSGRVRVTLFSLSGKEVTFRDLSAGEMFGELAAIDGQPRSASVIALADSLIASLSGEAFWEVLREQPEVAAVTLKRLAANVRDLSERVFEFSTLTVNNRIQAELLRLAHAHMQDEDNAVIAPAPTHAEIASRVSTHREAVTRELSRLARAGVIERRAGKLLVLDVPRLRRMVENVLEA